MATLALAADVLVDRVEERMGWSTPTAPQTVLALEWLNNGMNRFLMGLIPGSRPAQYHDFLFLRPYTTVTVWPTITTAAATVGGAGGTTMTVAADTFYATMVGHTIVADTSENEYTIAAYSTAKVLTLATDGSGDTGDTFTITADGRYALPTDFSGLVEPPVYAYVSGADLRDLDQASLRHIYRLMRDDADTDDPTDFSLEVWEEDVTASQRWWLRVFPVPDTARSVIIPYRVTPTALTDSSSVYPPGGIEHTRTILQFAYAEAERATSYQSGPEEAMAQEMMLASITLDKALYSNAVHIEQMTDVDTGLGVG